MSAANASLLVAMSGPRGQGPLIGRRAARQLARRELSRSIYQQPLFTRIMDRIGHWLREVFNAASNVPGGWWSTIALLVALVLVVAGVIFWIRPSGSRRLSGDPVLSGTLLSARDHRELAERLATDGDYGAAIVERMRALAVEFEERGLLPVRPGRTADELAAQAGRALPDLASEFAAAALLFDGVRYGGRDGSAAGYEAISRLDAAVQAARAGSAAPVPTARAAAVGPR